MKTQVIILCSLLGFFASGSASASDDAAERIEASAEKSLDASVTLAELRATQKSAEDAFATGNFQESLKLYHSCMTKILDLSDADEKVWNASNLPYILGLAKTHCALASYTNAKDGYQIFLNKTDSEVDPQFLLDALNGMAEIHAIEGKFNLGEALLNRAINLAATKKIESLASLKTKIILAQYKLRQEKLEESNSLFSEVVSRAEQLGNDAKSLKAEALQGLADVLNDRRKFKAALDQAEKSLEIRKEIFSEDSLPYAASLRTVADSKNASNPEEADQLRHRALAIQIKRLGTQNHPLVASTLLSLVDTDTPQAEYLCKSAKSMVDGILDEQSPFMSTYLGKLTRAYAKSTKYRQALSTSKQLVVIRTALYGPRSIQVARALNYLAYIQLMNDSLRYDYNSFSNAEAEKLIKTAMEIAGETVGLESYEYGVFLDQLGSAQYYAGDYAASETSTRAALEIFERLDIIFANSQNSNLRLLSCLLKQKKMTEARALAAKQLDQQIQKSGLYDDRVSTLFRMLGDTEPNIHNFPSVDVIDTRITRLARKTSRANVISYEIEAETPIECASPEKLKVYAVSNASKTDDGDLLSKALRLAEQKYGANSPALAPYLVSLGTYYIGTREFSQATVALQRAILLIEDGLGDDHAELIEPLDTYADLLRKTGNEKAALEQTARSAKIKANLDEQHSRHE